MLEQCEILILGAGVTGLGAAWRARELGQPAVMLEAAAGPGGLAASFRDEAGFTWDCGVHLHFSHYEKYDEMFEAVLGPDEWIEHSRATSVWMHNRYVPYPVQLHLHHLPATEKWVCLKGLMAVQSASREKPKTFRDWILQTFGEGLAEEFLVPYNEKIWTVPVGEMNARWVGERVAVPNLEEILRRICLEEDHHEWGPNAKFRYPLKGGSGEVWRRVAATFDADQLRLEERAVEIDVERQIVATSTGRRIRYGSLVSTIPLDRLCDILSSPVDFPTGERLHASRTRLVGLGMRGEIPESIRNRIWVYYPDRKLRFYRLTFLSNLTPFNVPDEGCWSIVAEVAERQHEPPEPQLERIVEQQLREIGLINAEQMIGSRWNRTLPYGYPIPTLERDSILEAVLPQLEAKNIYSRGRFGGWRYEVSNQDHSFMQGVEVAERIINGREEMTLFQADLVNSRKNPFPYPEWQTESQPIRRSA